MDDLVLQVLFYHVPLKRDQGDCEWKLRLNDTPNAIGCTCRCIPSVMHVNAFWSDTCKCIAHVMHVTPVTRASCDMHCPRHACHVTCFTHGMTCMHVTTYITHVMTCITRSMHTAVRWCTKSYRVAKTLTEQCVAVCCSVLQSVAVCCSVLQCNTLCCWIEGRGCIDSRYVLLCVAVCCSVLQCVAV